MVSKGSCDTEDWSNDAENSALHHRNKLNFAPPLYYMFYSIFDQINAYLVSIRDFFFKNTKTFFFTVL